MSNKVHLSWLLFLLLSLIYFLTYVGVPLSTDELYLFDEAESLLRRGNTLITYHYDFTYFRYQGIDRTHEFDEFVEAQQAQEAIPWQEGPYEPLQPALMTPLFWIGQTIQPIGLMHTVWLFNVLVTALTGAVLFLIANRQGYSLRVSLLGVLLYGFGTIAWVYSQYLFREPLTGLFLLLTTVSLLKMRQHLTWPKVMMAGVFFIAAVMVKIASLALLPSFMLLILPSIKNFRKHIGLYLLVGILAVAGFLGFSLLSSYVTFIPDRVSPDRLQRFLQTTQWQYVAESLVGYHFSPGRSFWLYSPVLLLALPGGYLLWRQGKWRLPLALGVALLVVPMAYGKINHAQWWGAKGWGPRFLVPIIPMMMLAVFPLLAWIERSKHRKIWYSGLAILFGIGVAVQLLGTLVHIDAFYNELNQQVNLSDKWGIWSWRSSHLAVNWRLLDWDALNTAWRFADPNWLIPGLAVAGLLAITAWLGWMIRHPPQRQATITGVNTLLSFIVLGTMALGLYTLRDDPRYTLSHDPRYTPQHNELMDFVRALDAQVLPDDAVLLTNKDVQLTFLNFFKTPALFITLPPLPGEAHNPADQPQITSADPAQQLGPLARWALQWSADHHQRVWIIETYGPSLAFARRPAERYMVENHFPISRIEVSSYLRAISFDTTPSPTGSPAIATDYIFGDQIALQGFDLPKGATFKPGEVLPVSLVWRPVQAMDIDYNVSVQLVNEHGMPVTQRDGVFQDTFGYTSRWEVDRVYRDNHGLPIPANLAPGTYTLQTIIYTWQDGKRLEITGEDGDPIGDIAHLSNITVE